MFEKFTELDSKIEQLQARKDFAPVKEVNELQSQVAELNQELDEIPNLPDREEIKGIIEFYEGNKKKINNNKDGIVFYRKAQKELKKMQALVRKNKHRIHLVNRKTQENKAAQNTSFHKLVSSIKKKVEKF